MKKLLIYIATALLLVGSLSGATFKAQQGYDIDGTRVMDTVYIKVYGADDLLDTTVSWKPSGGDKLNTDTTIDGRYKLAFTYTSLEEYTISSWGYLDGTCYYNTYNKWPFEAAVVPADTNVRGEYLPQGNMADVSELVINGGFEADSTIGNASPRGWTGGYGVRTATGIITNPYNFYNLQGRWRYRLKSTAADTIVTYQSVVSLSPGIYRFSAIIKESGADRAGIFLDSQYTPSESGWFDSVVATEASYKLFSKTTTITKASDFCLGLYLHANSADDYADFENVSFRYIAPLSFVAADTSAAGDSIMTQSDTTACQGAGMSLTAPDIADAVWDEQINQHTTGGSVADVVNDSLDSKVSAVTATVSNANMGAIADSTWLKAQSGAGENEYTEHQFGYLLDGRVSTRSTFDVSSDEVIVPSNISTFDAAADSVMARALITAMAAAILADTNIANNALTHAKIASGAFRHDKFHTDCIDDDALATTAAQEIATAVGDIATVDYSGIDSTAAANPTHFYGPSGAAGDGTDLLTYYAKDTTTDNYIESVLLTVFNTGGTKIGTKYTSSSGCGVLTLVTGNTYHIQAYGPQLYHWESEDTVVMGASETTDSILGWYTDVSVSAVSKHCDVTVIVRNTDGSGAENVNVSAYMLGNVLVDSNGYAINNRTMSERTDSDGKAVFTCVWSSYVLSGTDTDIKWRFQVHARGRGQVYKDVIVPRQTSYTVEF